MWGGDSEHLIDDAGTFLPRQQLVKLDLERTSLGSQTNLDDGEPKFC